MTSLITPNTSATQPPVDLPHDASQFFAAGPEAATLGSAIISDASALQALGTSPFPKSGFPLVGFMESVYDHLATHAAKRLPP